MRTVCTVQARMGSSRLPGKVLLPILGRPVLELMIERLRRVVGIDEIVVASSIDPWCDDIAELCKRLHIRCYRGSEEDVLERVLNAARVASAELIVQTTGDCPLIDPRTVTRVIDEFRADSVDYCSNILRRTYPRGMDVQVFPLAVLERVAELTKDPVDREHVSLYIYQHPELFKLKNVESHLVPEDWDVRLTLDTPEDMQLITKIYERLYPQNPSFVLEDILNLMKEHPELRQINSGIAQKPVREYR